jgi:O-antigen/teichoic acid export membrane protein
MIKKYLITFRNALLSLLVNFISFTILPKSIALSEYALYQFSMSFFTNLRSLLNLAVTGGVFQIAAKYKNSRDILNIYIVFLLIQSIIIVVFFLFMDVFSLIESVFSSNNIYLISIVGLVEFTSFIFVFLLSYGDAKSLTVEFQKIRTYELLIKFCVFLLMYEFDILNIMNFLAVTLCLTIVANLIVLKKLEFTRFFMIKKNKSIFLIRKVMKYSLPLAMVEVVAVFYNMADMFIIQSMLGLDSFAIYIYAYKLILVIMVFIQPVFNIFWHYIVRNYDKNINKVQTMFYELFSLIYMMSFMFMLFLLSFSDDIIKVLADNRYAKASDYLSLLAVVIIPLSVEKLTVVTLYASNNTKKYRNIVLVGSLFSIVLSLTILMFYRFDIIDENELIWVIICKVIIYSYVLNGYLLNRALKTLSLYVKPILMKVVKVTSLLFLANIYLIFDFEFFQLLAMFCIVNGMILLITLYSFQKKINVIEGF